MKKSIYALFLAFCMLFLTVPVHAATVDKNDFHFSDMHLKRVWFQNMDPIFKVDHYEPIELAEGLNITGVGNLTNVTAGESSDGFLAPMEEFFYQIGGKYDENEDTVTMSLNGDTLVMTVDSTEVKLNGESLEALPDASKPQSINITDHPVFGPANPLVASDVEVIYLPVRYILETFQAAIYWDGGQSSIYAVVKVLKDESNTIPNPDKQGSRLDQILSLDVNENKETALQIANNIVALQNKDGGFMNLTGDVDMVQDKLVNKVGIKCNSSIEGIANGQVSTVTELRFLANMIQNYPDEAELYKPTFKKGIQYLLDAQFDNGGWALQKDGIGYYSTIAYADNAMVSVLTLFNDIARLNNQDFIFFRKNNQGLVSLIDEALEKGINCLINTQITVNDNLTGWSSHHHPVDLVPVIGKTYERAGINATETTRVADFLISVRTPSDEVKVAVESAVAWLDDVKINGKKMKTVTDITMNNGIERFLIDEADHVTWARNYKESGTSFDPFFSDRQLNRGDIPLMNFDPNDPRGVIGTPAANKYYSNYNVATDATPKIMFYETRTEYEWYVETPRKLIETDYVKWKNYLENGWPELPVDPEETQGVDTIVVKPVLSGDVGEASVSKKALNDAFAQTPKVKGVKIVKVLLEEISGAKSYELNLPSEFLTNGAKNQRIQLSTEFGTLTLEGHMLSNAKVKDSDTVTVSISAGTSDANKPSIELGVKANGKHVNYNHPGAPVNVVIPYEPTVEELKNPGHIGVTYIDVAGKRTLVKTGKYEVDKGGVTFTTTHFGQFEVVYK